MRSFFDREPPYSTQDLSTVIAKKNQRFLWKTNDLKKLHNSDILLPVIGKDCLIKPWVLLRKDNSEDIFDRKTV